MYRQGIILLLAGLVTACGSGKESDTDFLSDAQERNVAAATEGATASASYDSVNAVAVIDGDRSAAQFWIGNVQMDSLTIDLGQSRSVSEFSVFTNDLTLSMFTNSKQLEVSEDATLWHSTGEQQNVDTPCQTLSFSNTRLRCQFSQRQAIRYFRLSFRVPNIELERIYEIEMLGF